MRVKRSLKNFIYAGILQIVSSLLSFIVRYVLIHTLGIEAVSLNGLFKEVIAMLSLAEMGVGTVIVYNLYAPLQRNDEKKLAELMNLFKSAYRLIAISIFGLGLLLLPYIHLLVSRMNIDLGYLRAVYFLFLVQTSSSYLWSYKSALLNADQKDYIISRYALVLRTLFTGISIVFLILTRNYILYLLLQILSTLVNNFIISAYADRQYAFLKRRDCLPAEEKKQVLSNVKHLFIGTLSGTITNSTDNILISVMVGTLHIGAYSSYTMLINPLKTILNQLRTATKGSIGNLMVDGDSTHIEAVLRRMTFITYFPAVIAATGVYTVSTPFILLLFGEAYLLPMPVVFVCAANLLIYLMKNPLWSMIGVSGLFAQDKNISIIGDVLNLLVSIILGKKWGIAGILLGTSCTLIFEHILKIRLFFRQYLHLPDKEYVRLIVSEAAVGALCMLSAQIACDGIKIVNPYLKIFFSGVCSVILTVGINFLFFYRTPEFRYAVETGKKLFAEGRQTNRE